MIQRKFILGSLVVLLSFSLFACTSVDTQDEESMVNMDQELSDVGQNSAEGSEELGAEDFSEDFGDSAATEPSADAAGEPSTDTAANTAETPSGDEFNGDFSDEDFSGEDFSEDEFGDATAQNAPAEKPVPEPAAPESSEDMFKPTDSGAPSAEEFAGPEAEPAPEAPIVSPAPVTSGAVAQITNIRYKDSARGGELVIEGDSPLNYQTRFNPDTNQFIIEIPGASLPERLKRPYLMKEFPRARFGAVNAYQKTGSNTARIVVQLKKAGEAEPLVQVDGNSLSITPETSMMAETTVETPPAEGAAEGAEVSEGAGFNSSGRDERILGARTLDEFLMGNNKFYGRPISIQIKDADIRDVLNFIADESGANIVIADDITSHVTIKLRQVPWDQALVTVMRANKLGYVRQGSVIRIAKLDALRDETNAARDIIKAQKDLRPVRVKVLPVSYARVEDMVTQFKDFFTKDKGSIIADIRTSSLIMTDDEEVLERVSRLVKELDVPPSQVMIEGKVVEAGENFIQNVGVNWGFSGTAINLGSGKFGDVNLSPNMNVRTVAPEAVTQGNYTLGLNIGTLDVLGDLSATLSLAETDNLLKVISSPRIVTMNKEKATIRQQTEQVTVVSVTDPSGTITRGVQRTPIVVQLVVTPQITNDANVILDVEVQREFAGALVDQVTNARAVNSRSAKTKIFVHNGQTAVIGGIYQSDSTETTTGIPLLKDIPVLGWLFKSRSKDLVKNELLIFLTPRILDQKAETARL
jgi:type IV pilus assembly protein PilQ